MFFLLIPAISLSAAGRVMHLLAPCVGQPAMQGKAIFLLMEGKTPQKQFSRITCAQTLMAVA